MKRPPTDRWALEGDSIVQAPGEAAHSGLCDGDSTAGAPADIVRDSRHGAQATNLHQCAKRRIGDDGGEDVELAMGASEPVRTCDGQRAQSV